MSSSEPPQPKRRSVVDPSPPGLAVQSAVGVPSPAPAVQPELPPVKVDTLMTGDAKVGTHPQSMVGPAPAPQFQTLGRYTIIGELGRGGMGVVYLADDTVLKRKVALKIPQFEPDKAKQMQARFVREAQMAAQLSHINICQIYDVGVIDGQYVMAMEYIDGKTLSGFTKAGKLISERQAVYFVRKVAIAVEAAHQKGLVHRDLKPGNIMLPKADPVTKVIEPKVMDFGLAKSLEARTTELTKSGMIVGTPCYMSKEQWSGREAQLGPQCDIYSLGIILYELLTGKLPYDVDDEEPATAWFVKLVTQPQIRPTERKPDVDPALDAIVMRAIAKEAADRYPSMAELAKDLDAWLKGKAKPAGQSLVGQLPPGLLPLAQPPVNLLLDLGDIESIKSQPSLTRPTRRKPPGAIPTWALWAAGGAAVFLMGITFWFSFEKKPDGTVKATGGLTTTEAPKEAPLAERPAEQPDKDGWTSLFDGTDVSRWSKLGPFSVDNGQLVSTGVRGNAITRNEYSDFELEAEWRIGKGGNSGIYYREPYYANNDVYAGNEFSIADDASFDPSVLTPDRRSGSLYGVIAPSISATKPEGEWNQTRIVCRGTTVEHWLNGGRIVRYDTASNEFRQAIAQSTIKVGKENIGTRHTGRILLQSHTGEVAFRSIRIRELTPDLTPTAVDADSASAGTSTSTDGSDKESGITRLKEALVGYSWNYVDSLYPPGGPIRFYPNGKFHDQWKWNYWVVGSTTMHVQFWDANYAPDKSVVFTFNEDLTRFTAEFDKHKVTGTRLNAILADSSATDPVTQLVGIQNGDFSDGLNGWQTEENATDFKVYPLPSGGRYMTTHNGVYDARGRLFQTFDVPIDATRLEFSVHGGNSPSMYVALTENGKVLHQATGKNTNDWSPIAWDVSEFRGKQVTLEIVDQLARRAWGHIGAYGFKIVRDTTMPKAAHSEISNTPRENLDEMATEPVKNISTLLVEGVILPGEYFRVGSDEVLGDFTLTILKRDGMMLEGWYFKQDRINNDTGRNVRFTGQVTGDQLHIESDNELAPFEADGGIVEGVLALDFTATRTGGEFKMKAKIPPSISSPTLATTDVIEGMTGATTGMFLNPQASDNLGGPSEVPGSSADESMDENAQESQGKSTKLSLEEKDQKQIDLAISKYEESSMAADAVLLAAIDREIENVRKQPRLTGEQQQQLIDALGVEKATFEQHRTIPFSPRMRAAANVWVNNIEKARIPAAKTYDKVIGRLTRAKEDEEAAQRQDEKQRLVGPKVIGVWDCKHYTLDKISYRLYLYSNHQAKTVYESELPSMNRTWKLDNDQLIIELIVQAGSPIPTFGLDACDIAPSGQTLSGVDLKDGGKRKFNASRVDE